MTLEKVPVGQKAIVKKLYDTGAIRRRIMDMGITKGTEISVVKVAPLGDPIQLSLRGYNLTLRAEDAKLIEVA